MDGSKKTVKKVFQIILNVILWLFVAFSVVITVLAFAAQSNMDGIPSIGGTCIFTVESDSMEPEINKDDIIICSKLTLEDAQKLEIGDIITFKTNLTMNNVAALEGAMPFNTHKIIAKETNEEGLLIFTTHGVNNPESVIEKVSYNNVYAQYSGTRFAKLGAALRFLQQPKGFLVCIVLPLVAFFLFELFRFFKTYLEIKNSGKKQISAADEELIRQQAIAEYLKSQQNQQSQSTAENAKEEQPVAPPAVETETPAGSAEKTEE